MPRYLKIALLLALLIHIIFFLLLWVGMRSPHIRKQPSARHIFELRSLAAPTVAVISQPAPPPLALPNKQLTTPLTSQKTPSAPTRKPIGESAQPKPKPIRLSKEAFDRLHTAKQGTNPQSKPGSTSTKIHFVPVGIADIQQQLQQNATAKPSAMAKPPANDTVLADYQNAIKPQIERAWHKPPWDKHERSTAVVGFDVLPTGAITDIRPGISLN